MHAAARDRLDDLRMQRRNSLASECITSCSVTLHRSEPSQPREKVRGFGRAEWLHICRISLPSYWFRKLVAFAINESSLEGNVPGIGVDNGYSRVCCSLCLHAIHSSTVDASHIVFARKRQRMTIVTTHIGRLALLV